MVWMRPRCDTPGCRARSRATIEVGLVSVDEDGEHLDAPVTVKQRFCWKHAFAQACEHLQRAGSGDGPSSGVEMR